MRLVILTDYVYWEDEIYFVDGQRCRGLLTQFLPIIEGGIGCSRTRPVQDATIDLRLLREAPRKGGARVIGHVSGPKVFTPGLTRPAKPAFTGGAKIKVTGRGTNRVVTTDSSGLYDLDDLSPGDYTLQLLLPDTQIVGFFKGDEMPARIRLETGRLLEKNFDVFWNGRIEGRVEDEAGRPAHAWVELEEAGGRRLPAYADSFELTTPEGSYQFHKVPPGRYVVRVNPHGPNRDWPFDLRYYPSGGRKNEAQVFEWAAGQRVTGVDFRVPRLQERNTRVQVRWANGTPAADASICLAYENTADFNSTACTNDAGHTDQNGLAALLTYGRSQIRVFAEKTVDDDGATWFQSIYSRSVRFAADKTPERIDLVLPAKTR